MLCLMRKVGESISLKSGTESITLKISNIDPMKSISINNITERYSMILFKGISTTIEIGGQVVELSPYLIGTIQAKISIDAPREVKILRSELKECE